MRGDGTQTELEIKASEALVKIGEAHGGADPTAIALAWVRSRSCADSF